MRLSTFASVCLLSLCVCQRLSAFVCVCLHLLTPPLAAPPLCDTECGLNCHFHFGLLGECSVGLIMFLVKFLKSLWMLCRGEKVLIGNETFGLRPQIQIAAGLNPLRFENRKPNLPLFPDLLFLAFLETARKTTKKNEDFSCLPTPQILGKRGENAQNRKECLEKEKGKEIQKGKEKKIRV